MQEYSKTLTGFFRNAVNCGNKALGFLGGPIYGGVRYSERTLLLLKAYSEMKENIVDSQKFKTHSQNILPIIECSV